MRAGTIDAVFDEGINTWGPTAMEAGFRFARLRDPTLAHMEEIGWPTLPYSARFPTLTEDALTISFSGWPIYTHADLLEEAAYQIADAVYRAREAIQWDLDRPVELTDLCGGTPATPIGVPLHPGAERFYRAGPSSTSMVRLAEGQVPKEQRGGLVQHGAASNSRPIAV
jgi:hypothetical protein